MLISNLSAFASAVCAWSIEKGGVAVTGQGSVGERQPFSSLTGPVEMYEGTTVDIAFSISGTPQPHQVFVRVSADSENDGIVSIDKIVPAKVRGKTAKVSLPFPALPTELHNYNLDVSALLSDSKGQYLEEKSFDMVAYGEDDAKRASLRKLTGAGASLASKPQIFHQFQAKPKHVNFVFASVFVAAIDALAFVLARVWKETIESTKLSILTKDDKTRSAAIGFIESEFVSYFISMSIFDLIKYSFVPLSVFFVISNRLQKTEKISLKK